MTVSGSVDQTRLRASSPEDLLAMVPYLLGFRPEESLVVVMLRGVRVLVTARIDLPPPDAVADVERLTDHFAAMIHQQQADRAVVAIFSADWDWSEQILARMLDCGDLPVTLALHSDRHLYRFVDEEGWLCGPYSYDPTTSTIAAEAVVAGLPVAPNRAAIAESIAPATPDRALAVIAAADEVTIPDSRTEQQELLTSTVRRWAPEPVGEQTEPARWQPPGPQVSALAGLLALDLEVRDEAWLVMRRETAAAHRAFWAAIATSVPPTLSAAPVALAGWAAWLEGNGALAWCCVDRVASEHPGYGLGELLGDMLNNSVSPAAWAPLAESIRSETR